MSTPTPRRPAPVVIEADDPALAGPAPSPADAPPLDDMPGEEAAPADLPPPPRRFRWFGRLFWSALVGLIGMAVTVAAYDFVAAMLARNVWLGRAALALAVVIAAGIVGVALREMAALARLGAIDGIRRRADYALREADLAAARGAVKELEGLYRHRPDLAWARSRMETRREEPVDADALLELAEREYLAPLDRMAEAAAARAARRVATVTAFVPLALADVAAAFIVNISLLREIAAIYGGRGGALGAWRLLRAVAAHLAATGAVAIGDDVLGPVLGGGALAKLSRHFGEGMVNGALTARVAVAAMEICRPLPYAALPRPRVTRIVSRAFKGFVA